MILITILLIAFGGAFVTYLAGKISGKLRNILAVLVSLALVVLISLIYRREISREYYTLPFLNLKLILMSNPLSWFFAIIIAGIGLLSILYSLEYMKDKERLDYYYFTLLFINASMLGTVISGDLLSFFIFWEIMSWSTYLLISYKGGKAIAAGLKYIIMSIIGSLAMLLVIISLYSRYGTMEISAIASYMQTASIGYTLFILITSSLSFVIINAFWPLHTWLPDAHAEAVSPFSSVLSAVLVRKGIYGLYLFMYVILGLNILNKLHVGFISFSSVLCGIGAVTIVFAAFTALVQEDSKRILAWSTVGQGGYMLLGIVFATASGMTGGMFHVLNHCIYIALLFFVAGAIEHRTGGIRNINELGGLIKRMPVTFIAALVGISGLIGIPLTNGFVSKWLIYKTLILGNHPFLAFAAFVGTWGTVLYGYKFIHNIFLGQLPEKYKHIKEAPLLMQLPMILLTVTVILFGVLPGIPLRVISAIQRQVALPPLQTTLFGIPKEAGELNMINVLFAILISCFIVWLLFRRAAKSVPVQQDDSYAAGSYVPKEKYHYTVNFYNPLSKMITPYLRDVASLFYLNIARGTQRVCNIIRRVYVGEVGYYAMYIVLFLAFLIFIQMFF
ncbi:hypothetical protein KAW65_00850 [candidate division WOR-3 bacterium]|nr:hypothetical protein [candidate division WOR-3 bacterium]